ncbi:Alcohol dehydrogenase-like 7 [Morella rubra]|uniref:Alcohol dehydrogenase-like 7 n=1 Tax=Morella rubra TaxID=262757 RepID=A0A6A1URL3_9ROSI|nr:Alcohol dehydrogenase-like 7 [Morella rubra]
MSTGGKPIRCRAAVCRAPGEPLVIEEIIVAPPMPREVRIRIICTSLCHTDIGVWKLKDPSGMFPRIFGHEAVGFSEYTVVDVAHVTKIDSSIPPNRACLLSCAVSTGVGAAWKTAKVEPGSTVAIFGLGTIGLAVAEGARFCGATRIIGVDLNPDKDETGKKFGITDFVNPGNCGDKSVSQVVNEMTGGGADYCFECIGLPSLVTQAYFCCRNVAEGARLCGATKIIGVDVNPDKVVIGKKFGVTDFVDARGCENKSVSQGWGKTIVLGVDKPGATLSLSSFDVLHNGKSLMGSLFGGLKAKSDIPILLKRYLDKELQLDEFVTHEVRFEEINKAFDLLVEGQCLRCVIWMDKVSEEAPMGAHK